MLIDRTVKSLLDAFASADPTPGGGSAAALVGATGASLLEMVTGMPKSRTNADDERTALDEAHQKLAAIRAALTRLVDRDSGAYNLVIAAFRLPKATDDEKAARRAAIQDATRVATEVPLETIRACVSAMRAGRAAVAHGNPSASSDVKVGYRLLMAAADSARDNVEINLVGLSDASMKERILNDAAELMTEAAGHAREVI